MGSIPKLLGGGNATPSVAPSLSSVIRQKLELQGVQNAHIDTYLALLKSLDRYNRAFRKLFDTLKKLDIDPWGAGTLEVVQGILKMSVESLSEAKMAYSASLLVPGFEAVRFSHLLTPLKRRWGDSTPKYAMVYDCQPMLKELASKATIACMSLMELRLHTILALRFCNLYRGCDLQNMIRELCWVQNSCFVKVKRKGWTSHRLEEIISVPSAPNISPWHLLMNYVHRTKCFVPQGGGQCLWGCTPPISHCWRIR